MEGLVLNWSSGNSRFTCDPYCQVPGSNRPTGHPIEIVKIVQEKMGQKLHTPSGKIMGEKSMWAERAEDKLWTIHQKCILVYMLQGWPQT